MGFEGLEKALAETDHATRIVLMQQELDRLVITGLSEKYQDAILLNAYSGARQDLQLAGSDGNPLRQLHILSERWECAATYLRSEGRPVPERTDLTRAAEYLSEDA